jgi:NAD(P)-dependent dehydrogenase (short-subunit alcohol dehydrogenase family)
MVTRNPAENAPRPPYPEQEQEMPGLESRMDPRPDYGEQTYRGANRLEGKRAIITGGDSGIGRAVALAFAREGAHVLISYLNEEPDAEETVRVVEAAGRQAVAMSGDIGQEEHCNEIVERALRDLGGIDILVNNAAWQQNYASIVDIPTDDWQRTLRTNLDAMFYLCRAALPRMPEGGAIINTTSIQAEQPSPSLLAYATTKGAIVTFTKALALEAIKVGVRVNGVAPGPVWTPLIPASTPAEEVSGFGESNPTGRAAQPAELAPVFVFLASDESTFVNGEVIGVTGGKPLT